MKISKKNPPSFSEFLNAKKTREDTHFARLVGLLWAEACNTATYKEIEERTGRRDSPYLRLDSISNYPNFKSMFAQDKDKVQKETNIDVPSSVDQHNRYSP